MGRQLEKSNGLTNGEAVNPHGLAKDPTRGAAVPIAVIGMSCKFPGDATSPEKLWQLCADGRSAWSEIPASRFNQKAFYHPQGEKSGMVGKPATLDADSRLTGRNFSYTYGAGIL